MAINPIGRPTNFDVPTYPTAMVRPDPSTWSNLASVGEAIAGYRTHQQVAEAINAATDPETGNLDFDKATANLSKAGLVGYAQPFMTAAARRQALEQTGAAQAETARHHRELEKSYGAAKVPFGWEPSPEGGYRPTAGGPQDPAYLAKVAELKQKPRELSMTDITKLSEEGGKYSTLAGFGDQFRDKYAGYVSPIVGGAAMTAGRYLPEGVVGKDVSEAAGFWQGYDRFKNVTRNELYGAALTTNEQRAFEQADVNPGMTPDAIRNNLRIQQEIVKNGLRRKANAGIAAGYDPETIAKAYGLNLGELGVDASGRRGTVAPAAPRPGIGTIPPPPPGFVVR